MLKILYIGNNLNNARVNVSAIQTLGPLLEKEGFKVYYASSKSNKLFRLIDMLVQCLYLSRRVDYVILDTYSTLNFYYALIISQLCRILRIPYLPILHGGNLPNRLKQSPYFSRLIFNNAKINIAPSMFIKLAFENLGYTNLKYIPNTIQIEKYDFSHREMKIPKLLWVRSFANIYNPSLAIKIVAELKNRGMEAHLCMVGPDSHDGSFEATKNLATQLNVKVDFKGKLLKEEWIELSKSFNIFINTTNFDNMPVSVIEAMALGLFVISTNVGGMPYLIEQDKNGKLVAPNKHQEFADAIMIAINNIDETQAMTTIARKNVEQLDWSVVKKEWNRVLS